MKKSDVSQLTPPETSSTLKGMFLIHYRLNFKLVCLYTALLPLGALITCLLTAIIFQFNDVQETHCRVFNIVPSISAVTGVSPQRYIWRISMAFHIGPRIIMSAVHNAYQINLIEPSTEPNMKSKAEMLLNTAYILNLIETGALCGLTYISNRENYPIHEKLFIIFMVSSLTHMLVCIQATQVVAECRDDNCESIANEVRYKKNLFSLSLLSTAGLIVFFLQHRLYCCRMAFSIFALCEYVIAVANILFHIRIIQNFSTEELMVGQMLATNGINHTEKADHKKLE